MANPAYQTVPNKREIFGHPAGLYVLFLTETWERFSYYGMRALLVLYMTKHLITHAQTSGQVIGYSYLESALTWLFGPLGVQPIASQIYGIYTGLVYLTPLFGGMLADRVMGQRRTVILGAVLMAIGHFLMANENLFFLALFVLIIGNGCFKPNITTQLGYLYPPGDSRRDSAFTIFYMGFNFGAFFSPLVCGTLGQRYGWHYGFGAAGIGMIIGLFVYLAGQKYLATDQLTRTQNEPAEKKPLTPSEWRAVIGLGALALLNIIFWAVFEQQGNTLQLFAENNTDWHIFGWEMPSTWLQSMNPMFIFFMSPLVIALWGWQARRKSEPTSVTKIAMGCVLLSLGFLPLMYATSDLKPDDRISFLWLMGSTYIYTLGELYLSPIGLSLVTKVSPPRIVGTMMGLWFLPVFIGNYLSGYLGGFYETMPKLSFFWMLTVLALASGVLIFLVKRPLEKAIGQHT